MLKRGENKSSVRNMKRALHRGVEFDHGGHGGLPVETVTKGNARSIFTTMWSPIFLKMQHTERDEVC